MGGLGEGDVDYDWLGEGLEAGAQQVAEGPGCVGGEGWEDEGAVYAVEFVEFARGEGDFGCHVFGFVVCFFWESFLRPFLERGWERLFVFVGAMGLIVVFVRLMW